MNWVEIGTITDIPLRGARCVKTPMGKIAVFRTAENEVFAIEDHCPHKGGPLSQGIVHGASVTCPLYNWVISLETGKAQGADEGAVRLDVRNTHGLVRVTCLQGSARIEHPQGRLQLQAGQQTRFDERLSGVVAEAVASEVSAWTEGMLVFRRAPLGEVVDEINRYRRGKVLLGESALARAPVSGRFRIDDPDAALEQLRLTMSLDLRRFPGGIAVLG